MKKFFILIFTVITFFTLSGCVNKDKKEEETIQIDLILQDPELKDLLYNKVCFNVYKKEDKWYQPKYQHNRVDCYYISTKSYDEEEEPKDLTTYEKTINNEAKFTGVLETSLLKEGNIHGVDIYNTNTSSFVKLLPVCHVNDKDSDLYCISTYWEAKKVEINKVIIKIKD